MKKNEAVSTEAASFFLSDSDSHAPPLYPIPNSPLSASKRLDIHIGIPAFENISYPLHKSSAQGSINDPMIIGV